MASDVDMITATITVPRGIWPEVLDYAARRTAEYVRGVPATPPSSMASDPNGAPATGRTYAVRDLVALGLEFPGGEGKTPPDNVVWGWDGVNRTLTMPTAIGAEFREALA